ncbi:hypothetical protein A0J61_10737 [Choanephora cucurbitarum]|uniref:Uncharacterized protein n=1 Tax=Choanephora cucurbitarum TaxID=101091 RepID=A0A1C7N1H6_9FUNG|nr:hypothetical protein A0J61_10737 [Choanephora cucurbitarum]
MSRQEIRAFVSRFRFQDNSLASFNTLQKKQIERFRKFTQMKPDGFCCICLCVLYKDEQAYRTIEYAESSLKNCHEWKLVPLKNSQGNKYMVCKAHVNTNEGELSTYVYPGDLVPEAQALNNRERCVLSPLKLMT